MCECLGKDDKCSLGENVFVAYTEGQPLPHLFPPCIALVFLLLAQFHWKRMLKEPTICHSYQFPNVPMHEWHSWKADDDGSSILGGLVGYGGKIVQYELIEILCDDSIGCKEAGDNDNFHRSRQDKRLI